MQRASHALPKDLAVAAALAVLILIVAPGFGIVAWFGLPLLIVLMAWMAIERGLARRRRRRTQPPS
jgi:hypothetical protein